jgi:hypothetical protein
MKAKDVVSGSTVRYKGMGGFGTEATLFHITNGRNTNMRLLAWEGRNSGNEWSWEREDDYTDTQGLDSKFQHFWWIAENDEVELIAPPKVVKAKITTKTTKLSEVKAGTRITIPLEESSYPCSPGNVREAASKITGTLFNSRDGSKRIIAWKRAEVAPHASWKLLGRSETFAAYSIPAGFERAYYLCYPDLEVEVETTQPAKTDNHLGFMLSCIGAGALLTSFSKSWTAPIIAYQEQTTRKD